MRLTSLLSIATHIFLFAAFAPAQTGQIKGLVVDMSSKPIADATVYALSEDKMTSRPIQATTDSGGHFIFTEAPIGEVYMNAAKPEEGYPYSIFSFYNLPGEHKPKIEVRQNQMTDGVLVQLGQTIAYLEIKIIDKITKKSVPGTLLFTRMDLPGTYRTSFSGNGKISVPPVSFRLSVEAEGYAPWAFQGAGGSDLIKLSSGEHLNINVILNSSIP